MGIKWQDKVTNLEVLDNAGLVSVEALILDTSSLDRSCHTHG